MSAPVWINVYAADRDRPCRLGVGWHETRGAAIDAVCATISSRAIYRLKVTPKAKAACAADAGQVPGMTNKTPPQQAQL